MKIIVLYLRYLSVRIFILVFILLISAGCYCFYLPQLKFGNCICINTNYNYILSLPKWVFILKYLSICFISSSLLLVSFTAYYILQNKNKKRIYTKYNDLLEIYLFDYLYDETPSDKDRREKLNRIKKNLKSDVIKRIFLNRMRRVHFQLDGEIRERNFNLLKALRYYHFIQSYLQSPYLRHKLFALRIISDLHLQGYEEYIYKLTKKKNQILSSEALVTLVKLYIYDDQLFLIDFTKKLSIWDINRIIEKVKQQKQQQSKEINHLKLIKSDINQISAIGIILARVDNKTKLKNIIKNKIESQDPLVSEQAFLTYISFANDKEDFDYLTYRFEIATENAQIQIIKKMGLFIGKFDKTVFLNWIVENKSICLKIESMKILLCIDSIYYNSRYLKSKDISIQNAYSHIDNRNLKF
ncbi:MAG: hypothetical protein PHS59_09440 [Paludibacter sp.]|nr:hypothetical protein [Paludibacter sp.]